MLMKARLTKLFTVLTILTLGITNVWGDETYKLFYGATKDVNGTTLNSEDFFTTLTSTEASNTVEGTTYTVRLGYFGGGVEPNAYNKNTNRFVRYDVKTTSVEIEVVAVAKNKNRTVKIGYVKEPGSSTTASDFSSNALGSLTLSTANVGAKSEKISFTTAVNASIIVSASSSATDISIIQVTVTEKGTPLPKPGDEGYAFRFQQGTSTSAGAGGRHGGGKAVEIPYEGGKFVCCLNSEHTAGTGLPAKISTKGTHYIKFTTAAYSQVNVSVGGTNAYYISDSKNPSSGTTYTTDASVEIDAGTWYIVPNGSDVTIKKISFESATPAATYDATFANGGHGTAPADATGVSSVTLTEITGVDGWKNTGWTADVATKVGTTDKAAGATLNIGDVVTLLENTTFTAQWANKYTVTYDKNGGTGTMADTYNEIVACTFTAPDGKAFKEWNTQADGNGTTYAVGATVTTDLNLFAIWKAAPTVLYSLTVTNSSQVNLDNGGATHDLAADATIVGGGAYMQNDHASSAQTILKSTSLRFKAGTVTLVMTLNTALKEGDTIKATGLNQSGICFGVTFNREENLANALGSDASYFIVPAEFEGETTLYAWRIAGSETTCSSIQIIRPVKYTVNFAAGTGASGTMAAKEYPAGAEVTLPECTFTAPTDQEFDTWTSSDVTITAGKFTMPANDVTITATWKAEATKYDITYYPGANGSGSIAAGKKTHDVAYVLSSERFTRTGYLQTGWATTDGGAQAYALGGTYTENADLNLYPVWTELDTYVAPFECATSAPAGWTFANAGSHGASDATVDYECQFGSTCPATGDSKNDNYIAFAKSPDVYATYDLGIATTVAAVTGIFYVGSSSARTFTIDYIGADESTVLHTITVNHPASSNWGVNNVNETAVIDNVRYIKVKGMASNQSWIIMSAFSVSYIETRTKYDVTFAAGTGASGSMDALHYIEGAEVVLPACTFTAPTDMEFDAWTSSDVTITDGKFTMPAKNVTVTATWKDAVTRFTVTFETNGGSSIDDQEVEINGHPAAVDDPTKDNYVFVGWYNNSDLADEHAVADITALTITEDITLYAKWALDLQVTKIVFSNGFDAFINDNTVTAYYMDGEAAPTIESYEANANVKTTDGVLIEGSKLVLVGTDDSRKEYNFTLDAVAPMTSFDKQTFDGSETYIKGGSGFAAERGWKFQKNADDGRIPKGLTRLYVFLGGGADKATFKSYAKRAVHVYVNNVLVSSVTELPSNAEFDIPLDPNDATNMIAFISNQTGGDAGIFDVKLNEHTISSDATLGALTVNGDAVTLVDGVFEYDVELAYGTSSAPTIVATANDAGAVATVVSCTLSGATIEVVPESGASDKKTYTLTFTVSRYPKIIIWDGATMSAVATSPDASGLEWAVTGFGSIANYSVSLDGKDYVKCLPSGGNGGAARNISLTIPDGYVGRVTIVFGSHSDDERGMFIGKTATKTLDETSILTLYSPGRTSLVKGTSLWSGGTYYINPMASVDFYEITVELTPGYARTDMLGAGVLGTICVDHNVAINEAFGASFYELAGKEATYGKIVFEEIIAGELEAGKPYVFQAEGNLIALLYGSTSVSAPVNTGALKGTFTGELFTAEQAAEKDIYFFRDHALWSAKETGLQVLANRAWLEMGDVNPITNPNPAPGRRRITLGVNGTNVATGLEDLEVGEAPMKVMMNGQLFILRGEKIYDATGRLVK